MLLGSDYKLHNLAYRALYLAFFVPCVNNIGEGYHSLRPCRIRGGPYLLGEFRTLDYVFVERDKKAYRVIITTGIKNDEMAEVSEGLNEGDVVVWDDTTELTEGMDIKVK